ncbi:Protein-only RNase P, C-terminal [Phytophthora cactorum]|nr:Protein-only RNase P, C-terminal [Phytophthora cactorum]
MQRLLRGLYAASRHHASSSVPARLIATSTSPNASVWGSKRRFLSVLSAAQEPPKLGRCARRRAKKQHISTTLANPQEVSRDGAPSKQQKDRKSRFNVHRYIVQEQMPLEDVLPMIQSDVRAKTLQAAMARQSVDSFYFHCAQQAEKKGLRTSLDDKHGQFLSAYSRWQQLKQHDVEWTSAMEDVLVQMVVACVKNDEQQLNEYTAMPESENSESHFHAQMASLLHDLQLTCREVSPSNAQRLLHAFRDAGYRVESVPSDARMRLKCPCCGHALNKQGMSEPEREHMLAAIESRRSKMVPEKTVKEFLDPFRGWLMLRHETFQLQTLAGDAKSNRLLHYVLDGPNIAYINQNFEAGTYRLDHVDAVAKELQAQGHLVSITMPAGYLADKFLVRIRNKHYREMSRQGKYVTRERTPEEKAIVARWKKEDMIFSCRTDFLSDDLFWLYASVLLGREGRVVTNDQGRDHVFALLNGYNSTSAKARPQKNGKKSAAAAQAESLKTGAPSISMDLVARWKDMTTVNIEIKHEETAVNAAIAGNWTELIPIEYIKLHHPQPFSRVPQVTAPQHFHFPIAEHANQNEHPNQVQNQWKRTRWLCVHRDDDTN